jgi:hypothetical protein
MLVAQVERLRCPACGLVRSAKHFGINDDGEFDPELAVHHDLVLRIDTIGGRGRLAVEYQPLPLPLARALRDAIAAALARLDAEITAAEE